MIVGLALYLLELGRDGKGEFLRDGSRLFTVGVAMQVMFPMLVTGKYLRLFEGDGGLLCVHEPTIDLARAIASGNPIVDHLANAAGNGQWILSRDKIRKFDSWHKRAFGL